MKTMTQQRTGDWMQTATGRRFYPLDPRPEEVCIEDIAAALSRVCRFGGHCREFYSVAQHCVHVSEACSPEDALWGLLHDAAEAYLGDLIRPLKRQEFAAEWREVEERLQRTINEAFGLYGERSSFFETYWWPPKSVKEADEALLATEARDLMGNAALETWRLPQPPLPDLITPWSPQQAEAMFLRRFRELGGGSL
jgi:uncharacterized protein